MEGSHVCLLERSDTAGIGGKPRPFPRGLVSLVLRHPGRFSIPVDFDFSDLVSGGVYCPSFVIPSGR